METTFRYNKNILINKTRESTHICMFCREPIGLGYSLSIHRVAGETKIFTPKQHSGNNVRIHINCIEDFAKAIINLKQENLHNIFALSLKEREEK